MPISQNNKDEFALADFVKAKEPLSGDKVDFILNYQGETRYIDFKAAFDTGEQREWLNITKDILAFANTEGGYLVFGVKDKTFEKVGIDEKDWRNLIDPDYIHKKVNAYIAPPITSLTSIQKVVDDENVVIVHIPASIGITHIVVKEGKFKNKKENREVILLRKGEIYVRRSASTMLIEPTDLDGIIERRISHYKDTLLSRISKVVEAPPGQEVLIFDPDASEIAVGEKKYKPITPQDDVSEIASVIALFSKDRGYLPKEDLLYRLYAKKKEIDIPIIFIKDIALMSVYLGMPCFYWLQFLPKKEIEEILDEISEKGQLLSETICLKIAACLGKAYFKKYLNKYGAEHHMTTERRYKQEGEDGLFFDHGLGHLTSEQIENEAEKSLNDIIGDDIVNPDFKSISHEKLMFLDYKMYRNSLVTIS